MEADKGKTLTVSDMESYKHKGAIHTNKDRVITFDDGKVCHGWENAKERLQGWDCHRDKWPLAGDGKPDISSHQHPKSTHPPKGA